MIGASISLHVKKSRTRSFHSRSILVNDGEVSVCPFLISAEPRVAPVGAYVGTSSWTADRLIGIFSSPGRFARIDSLCLPPRAEISFGDVRHVGHADPPVRVWTGLGEWLSMVADTCRRPPFCLDPNPRERADHLRFLRAIVHLSTGSRGAALADLLRRAECEADVLMLVRQAFDRLSVEDHRDVLASYSVFNACPGDTAVENLAGR